MTSTAQKKELDMTHGPLLGKIILYALPVIAAGMLQLLFNAADVVVVGRFAGGHALAAVGATGSLINLLVNVFMGMSVGVSVNVARAWGAKNEEDVSRTVHTAILTAAIIGTFVMMIGFFGSKTFLAWMGTPDDVIGLSTLYMQIYFLGMPASMLYNFGAGVLRSIGDTRNPLIFLSISGVVNVILNLILVIGFHMSVAGVAIATVVSQILSAVQVLIFLTKQKNCCRLNFRALRIYPDRLKSIVRIGIPAGLQSSLFSISNVILQSSVNSLGTVVMEANTAVSNLEGFLYIAQNSFYHAALTFVGQNVGAKQYHRVKKITLLCMFMAFLVGFTIGFLQIAFHEPLLSIYTSAEDPSEMIAIGHSRMQITSYTYFTCGVMEVLTGALRGLGSSVLPMLLTVFGVCGIRVAWAYTVFPMDPSLKTLYIAYPVSWIFTTILLCIALVICYRNFMRTHSENTLK
ncbi:MAG: MATE family efflux transporter [Ruminococcaceae bacterium]|nr:MATE family efflux transporter [Oscillospiraceae bacterium]